MKGPRRATANELKRVGVEVTAPKRLILHCDRCGKGWQPMIRHGGKVPRLYWVCPNKCNKPEKL